MSKPVIYVSKQSGTRRVNQSVKQLRSECLAFLLLQAQAAEALYPGRSSGPCDLRHCGNRAYYTPAALQAEANPGSSKPRNSTAAIEFWRATLQKGSSLLRRAPMCWNRQVSYRRHILSPPYVTRNSTFTLQLFFSVQNCNTSFERHFCVTVLRQLCSKLKQCYLFRL